MTAAMEMRRWDRAQQAERGYWYPADAVTLAARRTEERQRQTWYAGLLHIPPRDDQLCSVIELGAGPSGLTRNRVPDGVRAVAVEPMELDGWDREQYALANVELVRARAEDYHGEPADEVWLINVLQHVEELSTVLAAAQRLALRTVRVFEWVHEPTSVVHLHTIAPRLILDAFAEWHLAYATEGRARTPAWSQEFVAYVFERRWDR